MRARLLVMALVYVSCFDDFDRFVVVDGGGSTPCNDCQDGTCHNGACCRGCWDGTMCRAGNDTMGCGFGGANCQVCDDHNPCTDDKCTAGVCGADNHTGTCPSGVCVDGVCHCGATGEPCCPNGQACNSSADTCQNGHCGSCGFPGGPCCAMSPSCAAGAICNAGTNMCESCGGMGQLCCAQNSCGSGLNCGTDGHCQTCGGMGQSCCTQGNQCQSNLSCAAGMICECGGIGQACCGGTSCTDDANQCNGSETCQGTCQHVNAVTCTALDQCHDVGTCDPANGVCSNPTKQNGTSCSDGNMCTQSDICQSGVCQSGAPLQCMSGQHCISSTGACVCDPTSCSGGCCGSNQCEPGTADNACGANGNSCTMCATNQICQNHACVACGGQGQPCCHGTSACGANLVCDANSSDCVHCGLPGELCCTGASCDNSVAVCSLSVCISKNVWAVGSSSSSGVVAHFDGTTWSTTPVANTSYLVGIWGFTGTNVWATGVGGGAGIAVNWSGGPQSTPSILQVITGTSPGLNGIWGSATGDIWCGGTVFNGTTQGVAAHFGIVDSMSVSGVTTLFGVGGTSSSDVWEVGTNAGSQGMAAHWSSPWRSSPSVAPVPNTVQLEGVLAFAPDNVWVVGQNFTTNYQGTAARWDGSGWSNGPVPGTIDMHSLWASTPNDVWAVGAGGGQGVVVRWPTGWSATPTVMGMTGTSNLYGIWGSGDNDVWVVGGGSGGAVAIHWNGSSWSSPTVMSGANALRGVWGVAR